VAALGGIGFTVSLFIAELSFEAEQLLEYAKIGIFTGSIASALIGVFLLTRRPRGGTQSRGAAEREAL
jgi:NhaA family Na+:H+ antiporter